MTQSPIDEIAPTWGNIFKSEEEFLRVVDKHDQLIQQCAQGIITFKDFLQKYDGFYGYYALDGHESDEDERSMFQRYEGRIRPHEEIAQEIFQFLCSDEDAARDIYIKAGRFGSSEGLRRLRIINQKHFG
ncbi:MAG: hypothetical protein WBD27_16775 [Pyrinomonadaceae bacterium]